MSGPAAGADAADDAADAGAAGGDGPGDGGGSVQTELSRDMSLFDVTFIGIGAMIGAGVFALTGFAAGIAGPALVLAFVLNGGVALFTAVSYAELGAAFPEAGGGYLWVKEALVDPNGFYAGWMSWFAHAVACSLYAVTFGTFLLEFVIYATPLTHDFVLLGFVTPGLVDKALAVAMIAAFAYINFRGAEETGKAGVVVTGIKVLILGVFVLFGIGATLATPTWPQKFVSNPSFAPNGLVGLIGAMGFTYIAFEGYEIIVQSGEEVVDPGRNIPKAVFYSLAIVVPIYVLVAFAAIGGIDVTPHAVNLARPFVGAAPQYTWQLLGQLGELGLIQAAAQFVPYGVPLLLLAGLTATMSALNATIYSSSRVSFAMGRDGALPGFFDAVHPQRRTPHRAILLSAVLIGAMAVVLPVESVAAAADVMFILLFVQVNWTLIRMRGTHPDLPRTYRVPWMPWPPLLGIVLQLLLTPFLLSALGLQVGFGPDSHGFVALVTMAVWMGIGLVVYLGYAKGREAEKLEREAPAVVAEETPDHRDYRLLVPVANPRSVDQLMRTAIDLARDRDGEIVVMTVVTVPQQTPLEEGRAFVDQERAVLDEAMRIGEDAGVPVSGTIRIGHEVSTAILNAIEGEAVDAVLLGWRGRSVRRDFVFGSNVDDVIRKARVDLLVEKIGPRPDGVDRLLLPVAGGPHVELAATAAAAIARPNEATVHLVTVVDPSATAAERETAAERLVAMARDLGEGVATETSVVEGDDVVDAIVALGADHDITLLGASQEGLLDQLLFGAIPEQVSERVPGTVIMAKRHLGLTTQLRWWLGRR